MKLKRTTIRTALIVAASTTAAAAAPFTYQGSLQDSGAPANGEYDLRFELYTAAVGGTQIGPPINFDNVQVTDGNFQVEVDFGNTFNDSQAFIFIQVRDGASNGSYTGLLPRSPITATPKAQHATTATTANALENPLWQSFGSTIINTPANDTLLINRTNQITSSEVFGIYGDFAGFVGMYAAGPTNSRPFYGYSVDGGVNAYTYFNTLDDTWRVNLLGNESLIIDEEDIIAGNNFIANNFEYKTPKTSYISIPGMLFKPNNSVVPYTANGGFGGTYASTPGNAELFAPVQLPHGATVTNVTFYFTDNASGNLRMRLYKQSHSTTSFDDLASIDTNFVSGTNVDRTDSSIDFAIIDNTVNSYFLSVDSAGWPGNSTLSINSVIIQYTTTQAD